MSRNKKRTTDPHVRVRWRIGTFYQFIHSFAIMFLSTQDLANIDTVNGILTLGMALFSGSLYGITVTKNTKLGHITPFGGMFNNYYIRK